MTKPSAMRRPFNDWIARVESEVASDVNAESYRVYWQAGMTPAEAVASERAGYLEAA